MICIKSISAYSVGLISDINAVVDYISISNISNGSVDSIQAL